MKKHFLWRRVVLLSVFFASFSFTYQANLFQAPSIRLLKIEDVTATAVAWSPDGTTLAVGDNSGVKFFTENLELIGSLEQPVGQMKAIAWSPDGLYIAATGATELQRERNPYEADGKVYVWNIQTNEVVTIFDEHTLNVYSLAWSSSGDKIASGSWDRTIKIWHPLTGELLQSLSAESNSYSTEIMSISWSPHSNLLAAVAGSFGVFVWDIDTGDIVFSLLHDHNNPPTPTRVAWSPDGYLMVNRLGVLDPPNEEPAYIFKNCPVPSSMDWSPDGQLIALTSWWNIYICSVASDEIVSILSVLPGEIPRDSPFLWGGENSLDWHPDGLRLASARGDNFVRIWQVFE